MSMDTLTPTKAVADCGSFWTQAVKDSKTKREAVALANGTISMVAPSSIVSFESDLMKSGKLPAQNLVIRIDQLGPYTGDSFTLSNLQGDLIIDRIVLVDGTEMLAGLDFTQSGNVFTGITGAGFGTILSQQSHIVVTGRWSRRGSLWNGLCGVGGATSGLAGEAIAKYALRGCSSRNAYSDFLSAVAGAAFSEWTGTITSDTMGATPNGFVVDDQYFIPEFSIYAADPTVFYVTKGRPAYSVISVIASSDIEYALDDLSIPYDNNTQVIQVNGTWLMSQTDRTQAEVIANIKQAAIEYQPIWASSLVFLKNTSGIYEQI